MGHFHFLALSLSSNETSDVYGFLFASIQNAASKYHKHNMKPRYLMADAAFQISNGFKHTFPYVEDIVHWILMCYFHLMKAVNGYSFEEIVNKENIKDDIRALHLCANSAVFSHAVNLFLEKWCQKEAKFCDYFQSEWVNKHPNWFAAANLFAPNTNNAIEGFNSSIKSVHTLRRRLPVTTFKETMMKMLNYKSKMYVRDAEKKIFHDKLTIGRDEWSVSVLYAKDPRTKSKVFKQGESYFILSDAELDNDERRVIDGATASNLFYNTESLTFSEYISNFHQRVYKLNFCDDDWMKSWCSCPKFMSSPVCKHILSIAMLKRLTSCPVEANPSIMGQKPKRGKKSNAKGALFKPKT